MADMLEYYQQISELKKAVRERELQRLEIEKQALLSAQKRERRHEDFKDKIREIQKELNQREMEAAKNFQTLLARVDSIRKEHQQLAAHTEQLRWRKLQYEMSLKNANPVLHSVVHHDLPGIYNTTDESLWNSIYQVTSTPASKPQPLWASPPTQTRPQPLHPPVSPTTYSAAQTSHSLTQPVDRYMTRDATPTAHQQPPYSGHMEHISNNGQIQEPMTHSGILQRQGSANKIPNLNSHLSYVQPLTSPMTNLANRGVLQGQIPSNGVSQIHTSFVQTPSAYSQPSTVGYNSLIDIYKTEGASHNQSQSQPATRGKTEKDRSLDGFHIHKQDIQFNDRPMSSSPAHLQSTSNPSAPETSYLTHQHAPLHLQPQTNQLQPQLSIQPQPQSLTLNQQPSSFPTHLQSTHQLQPQLSLQPQPQSFTMAQQPSAISAQPVTLTQQPSAFPYQPQPAPQPQPPSFPSQPQPSFSPQQSTLQPQPNYSQLQSYEPQRHGGTSPMQSNGYPTPAHSSPLVTSAYGPVHTLESTAVINGAEKELGRMSSPLENHPHNSFTPSPPQPSSLRASQPDLAMQHSNVTNPVTYVPHPDSYINRDLPEKDMNGLQAPSERGPVTENFPSSSGEEITKNISVFSINEKAQERLSPRIYNEREQKEIEARIYSDSFSPSMKQDIPLPGNSTRRDSETKETPPEKPTLDDTSFQDGSRYSRDAYHKAEPSTVTNHNNSVDAKQDNDSKPHQPPLSNTPEWKHSDANTNNTGNYSLKDNKISPLAEPKEEMAQKMYKSSDSFSSSSRDTSPIKRDSSTRPSSVLPSKAPPQGAEESDTDFFDQNTNNITDTAAYKSLVSGDRKGSVGMGSESDEAEGQLSALTAKQQTTLPRPVFKPFASSIPSLRPTPGDTDTDSVDSVEAAIQAAMRKKDQVATSESPNKVQQPQSPLKEEEKSEPSTGQKGGGVRPGTDRVLDSKKPKPAVPLNLDSDAESYDVSAGVEASDEDDFDFYDKF